MHDEAGQSGCPACAGPLTPWREAPAAEPRSRTRYALWRCHRCGTAVTIGEAPADSHDSGAYRTGQPRLPRLAAPALARFDRRRLSLLGEALWASAGRKAPWRGPGPSPGEASGPRLLDIGAGRGRFVAAARDAGYRASGLEPSRRGVTAARETYGVELWASRVEDARLRPASWDVICLWHVLEHTDDPGLVIEHAARALAPGGVLLVGVPNLSSLQARLGGGRWFHLDLPRHRTHFTSAGLHRLLERHGLDAQATVHLLAEHNLFGMWQTLLNHLTPTPSYLYNLLKANVPIRATDVLITVLGVVLAPAAVTLEVAAGLGRRGGTIALAAVRTVEPGSP